MNHRHCTHFASDGFVGVSPAVVLVSVGDSLFHHDWLFIDQRSWTDTIIEKVHVDHIQGTWHDLPTVGTNTVESN